MRFDAVTFFAQKGHEHIAFVTGNLSALINEKKLAGYKRGLKEAGLSFDESYIVDGDYTYDSGIESFDKFLEAEKKPTAFIVGADEMALGIVHLCSGQRL